MYVHPEGTRVKHRPSGRKASVVRRMPENTAVGREADELEPVYELDFGGEDNELAPAGDLELLSGPDAAAEATSEDGAAAQAEQE